MRKNHVAVAYHFFPHYRRGVFDAISELPYEFTYFGAPVVSHEGIPALTFKEGQHFVGAPVRDIGGRYFQWGVVRAAFSRQYDTIVLLANPNFITTWAAALIGRLSGKRVIFWGHGFMSDRRSIKNYARKAFFSLGHAQYLYGYRAKCIAESFGFDGDSLYVGFNSLDYRSQIEIRRELLGTSNSGYSHDEVRVLGVSRLTEKCKYDMLLRAIAIAQDDSDLRFVVTIIGSGPAEEELKRLAEGLRIEVRFIGALYEESEVAKYIYSSDVVVQPGKVGLTAMHALMFGTPVISHSSMDLQMPEAEAIVEGKSGMLFIRDDVDDLARCLKELKKVFPDRALTRRRCFRIIDEIYNPMKQAKIFADALAGNRADRGDDILANQW